jgi:7-cyano-7-deazaguanine synthase in queuosine biosynthesis
VSARQSPLRFGAGTGEDFIEWQRDFVLDDQRMAHGLGQAVPAVLEDLLDLAMAAYIADRLHPRRPSGAHRDGRHWARELVLEVAVRDTVWQRSAVRDRLQDLLSWLTDDTWNIAFKGVPRLRRFAETQPALFAADLPPAGSQVALFSGGLDSVAGAARDLSEPGADLVLVSVATHSSMQRLQREHMQQMKAGSVRRLRPMIVPASMRGSVRTRFGASRDGEQTQRTRGFMFLAVGCAVAAACGTNRLRVYENGPGALNLAQCAAQTGAMTTRAMRPETLQLMSAMMTELLDRRFVIENPSFPMTKAQLVADVADSWLSAIAASRSCDTALTHRASRQRICGHCTSCLLRRQALIGADLQHLDAQEAAEHRCDVTAVSDLADQRLTGLHLMLGQAAKLRHACAAPEPWPAVVRGWPELVSAARSLEFTHPDPSHLLTDLLARYAHEWTRLPGPLTDRYFDMVPA